MFGSSESMFYNAALVAALVSLWGIMAWNGGVAALVVAAWTGKLEDGSALRTKYTGIPGLDFVITILVAFSYSGTDGSDQVFRLALVDGFTSLQAFYVWLYSEDALRQQLPRLRRSPAMTKPIFWTVGAQLFGGAVIFPVFFSAQSKSRVPHEEEDLAKLHKSRNSASATAAARALPLSFFVGAVLPLAPYVLPVSQLLTQHQHHAAVAAFISCPIWVSVLHRLFTAVQLPWLRTSPTGPSTTIRGLRTAYIFTAIVAAVAHVYAVQGLVGIANAASAGKDGVGVSVWSILARAYVPPPFYNTNETGRKLLDGPRIFLLYDCALMPLVSLVWAYFESLSGMEVSSPPRLGTKVAVILALFAGYVLLGGGCTMCLVLFWREGILLRRCETNGKR
ncbi:hypothetical protein RB595_010545 [Gaeumannomyces hyphopodioides]